MNDGTYMSLSCAFNKNNSKKINHIFVSIIFNFVGMQKFITYFIPLKICEKQLKLTTDPLVGDCDSHLSVSLLCTVPTKLSSVIEGTF